MNNSEFEAKVNGLKVVNKVYGDLATAQKILLFCHGFPGTNRLPGLVPSVCKDNLAVVEASYRGDKESEGEFSFLNTIKDIQTTATQIRRISKATLYGLGYSMGGFYVLNAIREMPSLFDGIILLCPIADSNELFSNQSLMKEYWSLAKEILTLKPKPFYYEEIKEINRNYNPINFASLLKTSLYVVQSTEDDVISFQTVKNFYDTLYCGKEFIEIPGLNHFPKGDEKQLINLPFFKPDVI